MKLCKRVPLTSKAMLLPFLREHFLSSDPPHDVLATSFEYRAGEGVDLLALTPEGRLVAVLAYLDPPTAIVDELLRRLQWMIENAPIVQRLFSAVDIDPTQPPCLVLAVPRLDERLRGVLRFFTPTELAVFEYRLVEVDNEIALLVEVAARYPQVAETSTPRWTPPTTPDAALTPDMMETSEAVEAPEALDEETEAALDEVVTRPDPMADDLLDDDSVEIHVDDMNVAELGVSEEELLELLNIHIPATEPSRS